MIKKWRKQLDNTAESLYNIKWLKRYAGVAE